MSAAGQISRFCSALIGGTDGNGDDRLSGQMIYVWTLPDKRTRWCRADSPSAIASAVLDAAGRQPGGIQHVYIGFGGVPEGLAKEIRENTRRGRPQADEISVIPALWADLDFGNTGHKGSNYPPDLASVMKILDSVGMPPTVIVHTGNGLQAWWVLSEPWLASDYDDPEAAREELAALSRDWISTLRFRADCIGGWKLDSVYDLSRVMRAPGTFNCKDTDNPKPVKIIGEINSQAYYELDDFRERLAPQKVLDSYALRAEGKSGQSVKELPGVNLSEVWARVTSEHYRARGYVPEWAQMLFEVEVADGKLEATWLTNRPEFNSDGSSYDAALVRILAELGKDAGEVSTERQVEAIMCRRLRAGEKPEKVDPARRTDYIIRTVGFVEGSIRAAEQKQAKGINLMNHAASARIPLPPEPDPEPEPPEEDRDTFAEYLEEVLDRETAPPPNVHEIARKQIEAQQGVTRLERKAPEPSPEAPEPEGPKPEPEAEPEPPRPPTGGTEAPRPAVGKAATPLPPPTPIRPEVESSDLWGERNAATEEILGLLGELLIPESFRDRGVQVWRLEHKDYGDSQRNRIVFRLPQDFAWPASNPPKLYRVGKPLFSEWYKRDAFDTPKGFRMALERDAFIPAMRVGNRKADWEQLISLLVSYWEGDSSSSDLASSSGEWLLEWLRSHAPTTEEAEALDNARALLVNHANWGGDGAPVIMLPLASWLSYVATQPGGPTGREGKKLLQYVHLLPRRPRLVDGSGMARRVSWYEIAGDQFDAEQWADILEITRQAMESREKRRMRVIAGGAS